MMNKQEFQRKIKNMKRPKFFNAITLDEAYEAGFEESKNNALFNSCFLDEPEKPVVPQYVADFYESIKDDFEDKLYELCLQFNNDSDDLPREIWWWFDCGKNEPIQTLVKMKIYGYEVEKEKLYTAKLKSTGEYLRCNRETGAMHHFKSSDNEANQLEPYHFTKDELIKYYAWENNAYEIKEVEE